MVWAYSDPRWLKFEKVFAAVVFALFVANILSWQGVAVFGSDPPFRPLAAVFLSGSMLLQAIARLALRRSYVVSSSLLASSFVTLWFSFTA